MTADEIDLWRWETARQSIAPDHRRTPYLALEAAAHAYRQLVRENVVPPAESDQDVLDTRAVLEAWNGYGIDHDDRDFLDAKQVLTEIKARVRREAFDRAIEIATQHRDNPAVSI